MTVKAVMPFILTTFTNSLLEMCHQVPTKGHKKNISGATDDNQLSSDAEQSGSIQAPPISRPPQAGLNTGPGRMSGQVSFGTALALILPYGIIILYVRVIEFVSTVYPLLDAQVFLWRICTRRFHNL